MFKLAVIIICHKNFGHVQGLIRSLKHENINIYIHVDKKNRDLYNKLNIQDSPNTKIYSIYNCKWGTYSIFTAMNYCLQKAYDDKNEYFTFISGEDTIIETAEKIFDFFQKNRSKNFIDYRLYSGKGFWNYKHIKVQNFTLRFGSFFLISPFKWNFSKKIFYSSQWININRETVKTILSYISKNSFYISKYYYSFSCDNFIYTTIIGNEIGFGNTINNNLRMIDWKKSTIDHSKKIYSLPFDIEHARSPGLIDFNVIEKSKRAKALFARKANQHFLR